MTGHKFVLEDVIDEVSYTLIALHCPIEDYRLAYLINKYLDVKLIRRSEDLCFNNSEYKYAIFEWEDKEQLNTWHLLANCCKLESIRKVNYESLFKKEERVVKTTYLIPEYKGVNFFLKIDNEFSLNKEKQILKAIMQIPQISIAYCIDTNQLKSKENLIFY